MKESWWYADLFVLLLDNTLISRLQKACGDFSCIDGGVRIFEIAHKEKQRNAIFHTAVDLQ